MGLFGVVVLDELLVDVLGFFGLRSGRLGCGHWAHGTFTYGVEFRSHRLRRSLNR